tara:strand:- start:229 stop:444 length:216 start_codon:yes stop_codon:yes gene_type:complete
MTAKDWTDAMQLNLEQFGPIPVLSHESLWREWAASISTLGELAGIAIPNPYEFPDWQGWAQRFNESLGVIV